MVEEQQIGDGIFNIPEANFKKFEAAIEKLSKKSIRLTGEAITPVVFGYEMKDAPGAVGQIKVFQVMLGGPKPKLNGWSFVGRIDHANKELGNIVRPVPGKEVPQLYRDRACTCDHCNINRFRRDTFVVQNDETLEYKQVGGSCLRDFLGHDAPEKIAKLAELLGYAVECSRGYEVAQGWDRRYINLEVFLAHAARLVRVHGFYATRTAARANGGVSTADAAYSDMFYDMSNGDKLYVPSKVDQDLTDDAIAWAQSLGDDGKQLSDFEHNIKTIAASGCCEHRSIGFAASIVASYMRAKNLFPQRGPKLNSQHLGKLAERLTLVVVVKQVKFCDTDYGGTFLHRFETDDGNVLTTFTGKKLAEELG